MGTTRSTKGRVRKAQGVRGEHGLRYDAKRNLWFGTIELPSADGQRKRKVVSGRERADVLAKLDQAKADAGTGRARSAVTVKAAAEEWLARQDLRATMRETYEWLTRTHLDGKLGALPVGMVGVADVERHLDWKSETLGKSALIRLRSMLGQVFARQTKLGHMASNPARDADLPRDATPAKVQHSLTREEVRKVLKAAQGAPYGCLVRLALSTGCRPGEAAGVRWADLDLAAGTWSIVGAVRMVETPAGLRPEWTQGPKRSRGGYRTVRLPADLVADLRSMRDEAAASDALVFPAPRGGALWPKSIGKIFGDVGELAGVPLNPYRTRHTWATLQVDRGTPLDRVADQLGDSLETVVRRYRHATTAVVDAPPLL